MITHRIDLKEPKLICRVYEAGTGDRAEDHPHKRIPNAFVVRCPAACHADEHPSAILYADTNHWHCYTHPITPKGGNILEMIKQMGVAIREPQVKDAARAFAWMERELGIERELRAQAEPRAKDGGKRLKNSRLVDTYTYELLNGVTNFQVLRIVGEDEDGFEDKDFRFRRPDGAGGWIYHVDERCQSHTCACNAPKPGPRAHQLVPITPFRYRQVTNAITRGRTVILNEGEKDAKTLARWNFGSTSYPFGANYPLPADAAKHLAGAKRVLLPADNDDDGVAAAIERARLLNEGGIPAQAIHPFREEKPHFDVTDYADRIRTQPNAYEILCDIFAKAPVIS